MYKRMEIILILALLSSGCLAGALTYETYADPDDENNQLILFSDGTYTWDQTDYHKSGEWREEEDIIYLDTDSFFGDTVLEKKGNSVFWSNGAEWTKQ
jgi:hypothetical protein